MDHEDEMRGLEKKLMEIERLLEAERDRAYQLQIDVEELNYECSRLQKENDNYCGLMHSQSFAKPEEMCVRPHLGRTRVRVHRNTGFILMPFGPTWASQVDEAVAQALKRHGMTSQRADRRSGREVMRDSWVGMCEAAFVIVDVTGRNPNVMYELGLADSVGLDVILIGQSAQPGDLPFDLLGDRILVYSVADFQRLTDQLSTKIADMRSHQAGRTGRRA